MIYKVDLFGNIYQYNYRTILVRIQYSYVLIMYYSDIYWEFGAAQKEHPHPNPPQSLVMVLSGAAAWGGAAVDHFGLEILASGAALLALISLTILVHRRFQRIRIPLKPHN